MSREHLLYVMSNVLCWDRGWNVKKNNIRSIAVACERYDGNYSYWEYEELIRIYGLKNLKKEI